MIAISIRVFLRYFFDTFYFTMFWTARPSSAAPRSPTLGLVGEAVLSLAYVLVRLFAALNGVLVSS